VSPLISHRFKIDNAESAYDLIEKGKESYLGILIEYPSFQESTPSRRIELKQPVKKSTNGISISVLGAGNFARMTLLPALKKVESFRLRTICSAGGLSAVHSGEKLGFEVATSDEDEVFKDFATDAVFVLTRHNQHCSQVVKALQAGKHVFTEKPLCITLEELEEIDRCYSAFRIPHSVMPLLMVGFNRRFSPAAKLLKDFFSQGSSPLTVSIRFNAGAIPSDHWTQDEEVGGGRIIGEACHAIDLATYLTGSLPVRVFAESIGGLQSPKITDDQCFITLRHGNGSVSNIAYWAGGDKAFPKERVEVAGSGRIAVIEDFKEAITCANGKIKKSRFSRQNKGHREEIEAFAKALANGGPSPIPWDEIYATTLTSILAVRSIREGFPFEIVSG
jgi:predicted dehydrogenase